MTARSDGPPSAVLVAAYVADELCEPMYRLGEFDRVTTGDDLAVLRDTAGRFEITVRRLATT